jgi:MFS family permease
MPKKDSVNIKLKETISINENYWGLLPPILSISILVLGMGALTTYTTLRLEAFNTSEWLIGIVSTVYFIGLVVGSNKSQHLVLRVGHIRSYAAFSATFAAMTLLQGLFEIPWLWIIFRYVGGFCLAGCFLVVESWLLGASNNTNRGVILAIYMISYYCGQSLGQLFLVIPNLAPLIIYMIAALFFSLSILPVSLTKFHAPYAEEPRLLSFKTLNKKAPIAIWGSLGSGVILSVLYSLYPLYLAYTGWTQADIAILMAMLLFGATIGQYPFGWLSDRYDRKVIIAIIVLLSFLALLMIYFDHTNYYMLMSYTVILGATAYTIYPISINHGIDSFTSKDIISASAGLLLAYGIGSTIGPMIIAPIMHENIFAVDGFIYGLLVVLLLLFVYLIYMILISGKAKHTKKHYSPILETTTEVVQFDAKLKDSDIQARHLNSLD